jgi:gluconokinase
VRSQFAALEPLAPEEHGVVIGIGPAPERLVDAALAELKSH